MIKLQLLLDSMITVILRYSGNTTSTDHTNEDLNKFIIESTEIDSDRRDLLKFILKEIIFLKGKLAKKDPFSSEELSKDATRIGRMLVDLKNLIKTHKKNKYEITINENPEKIQIRGLDNSGILTSSLCNSGKIIKEEIFGKLGIHIDKKDSQIFDIANKIVEEHNDALVKQRHGNSVSIVKKIEEESAIISDLQADNESKSKSLNQCSELIYKQDAQIKNLQEELARLRNDVNKLQLSISIKDEEIIKKNNIIEANHKKIKELGETIERISKLVPTKSDTRNNVSTNPSSTSNLGLFSSTRKGSGPLFPTYLFNPSSELNSNNFTDNI